MKVVLLALFPLLAFSSAKTYRYGRELEKPEVTEVQEVLPENTAVELSDRSPFDDQVNLIGTAMNNIVEYARAPYNVITEFG